MRSETTLKVSLRLSFEFSLRVDASTLSTTVLPAGITAPSDPATEAPITAVKRSPGLNVFVQTRATGRTPRTVPALTVPIAGAGGALGVDVAAMPAPAGAAEVALMALSCEFSGRMTTCAGAGSLGRPVSAFAAGAGFGTGVF